MFRNSEGYADPTAGSAFSHIAYERRKQRRLAAQTRKKPAAVPAAASPLTKEQEKQNREKRNQQREAYYNTLTWKQAWPKPAATKTIGMGGHD